MQISQIMAGFSLGHADILRRAMGKKIMSEMERMRKVFIHGDPKMGVEGALQRGYSEELASGVFDLMQKFADYGFNKSHAAGYAVLSYQTAYLKRYHHKEFMAALLTCDTDFSDKVVKGINECRKGDIDVLPPHINDSLKAFTVVDQGIRFGLAAVKNVGAGAVDAILDARKEEGPFTSLFDFFRRIDLKAVNKRAVESLIRAGAFDDTTGNRAQMLAMIDIACDIGQAAQHDKAVGQRSLFELMNPGQPQVIEPDPQMPDIPDLTVRDRLQGEKESLGFFVTGHPLLNAELERDCLVTHNSSDVSALKGDTSVTLCGIPGSLKKVNLARGDQIAFLELQDLEGSTEIMIPADIWTRERDIIESDSILVVQGRAGIKDSQVRVVADSIRTLSAARRDMISRIVVGVSAGENADRLLYQLQQVLKSSTGKTRVTMRLAFPLEPDLESVVVDMGDEYRVDLTDEFIERIGKVPDTGIIGFRLT